MIVRGGALRLLRRERRPIAALAMALIFLHSLVMAIGLAAPAAAATGDDAAFVILCAPGGVGPSTDGQDDGGGIHLDQPCALCQPQAAPAPPLDVPRPKRRPPLRPRRRPVHSAPPARVNAHIRPPNRAPPVSPQLP